MSAIEELKKNLRPGEVYRRAELVKWSKSVDRHIRILLREGTISKISGGIYEVPIKSDYGLLPAEVDDHVRSFLKDSRYLKILPHWYNGIGVGTTQLYNCYWIYNRKRHGKFKIANLNYHFIIKPFFPKMASKEYLLVDIVDSIDRLAEDKNVVIPRVYNEASKLDIEVLAKIVRDYGGRKAKQLFKPLIECANL